MKIYLREITEQEKEFTFTHEDSWIKDAVALVDEQFDEKETHPVERPIFAEMDARLVDEVIIIQGKIETFVQLICSRCAIYYKQPYNKRFSTLFCKDPVMAGIAHVSYNKKSAHGEKLPKLSGQNKGFARHAHAEEDVGSTFQDLDITYLTEEFIDLTDVISEQLRLQVPFQPLCKEDCKGMCSNCGSDLNHGRCACAKILSTKSFPLSRN